MRNNGCGWMQKFNAALPLGRKMLAIFKAVKFDESVSVIDLKHITRGIYPFPLTYSRLCYRFRKRVFASSHMNASYSTGVRG